MLFKICHEAQQLILFHNLLTNLSVVVLYLFDALWNFIAYRKSTEKSIINVQNKLFAFDTVSGFEKSFAIVYRPFNNLGNYKFKFCLNASL